MAKPKAAPARKTKTAAKKQPARAGAARKSARRKSNARKAKGTVRGTKKAAKKATRKAVAKATRRVTKKIARPAARAAKKVARKAPARAAKAPARKAAAPAPRPKAARAAAPTRKPALDRERRRIIDEDIVTSTPPSTLDLNRHPSAARSGGAEITERLGEHTETSPAITAGDVDADWESAYAVGDEAPGGDNPTPDQDVVDEIGHALGVEYQDNEELKGSDKIVERDRHRWELDPASSDDWKDR